MDNVYNLEKFEIVFCECGSDYIAKGKKSHENTIKHKEYLWFREMTNIYK